MIRISLVLVRRLPRLYWSMHFGDVAMTTGSLGPRDPRPRGIMRPRD